MWFVRGEIYSPAICFMKKQYQPPLDLTAPLFSAGVKWNPPP